MPAGCGYFSRTAIRNLRDLKPMRVFASSGDPDSIEMMRDYYTPVVLEPDQILLGLRNGMIDALPVPAFLANFSQVATYAPYMLDLNWAPITGALVVTEKAWKQLDPATQAWLRESSDRAGGEMRRASRAEDEQAVQAMKEKHGLKIVSLTPEADREFRTEGPHLSAHPRKLVPETMRHDGSHAEGRRRKRPVMAVVHRIENLHGKRGGAQGRVHRIGPEGHRHRLPRRDHAGQS